MLINRTEPLHPLRLAIASPPTQQLLQIGLSACLEKNTPSISASVIVADVVFVWLSSYILTLVVMVSVRVQLSYSVALNFKSNHFSHSFSRNLLSVSVPVWWRVEGSKYSPTITDSFDLLSLMSSLTVICSKRKGTKWGYIARKVWVAEATWQLRQFDWSTLSLQWCASTSLV